MKKIILSAVALVAFGTANAQEMKFGAKAGFTSLTSKSEIAGLGSESGSETGFFAGAFAEFSLSEKFAFKPEVLYVSVKEADQFQLPLHVKYEVAEGFGILAGPNLAFLMDTADGVKSFNYGLDVGASYDILENLVIDARYNFGLANLLEDGDSDNSLKLSGFYVGLGYKF